MNIVLLGPPGCGKGTQAKNLGEAFGLAHISTGEIFRDEIGRGTPLGQEVQSYVTRGALVPDELTVEVVASRLDKTPGDFLLDGFPRTVGQAKSLDKYLKGKGRRIGRVVYIELSDAEVVKRLGARWSCTTCNEIYNLNSRKPKKDGVCDADGGKLFQREDDKPEAIKKRLSVYATLTKPLIQHYTDSGLISQVDGSAAPEQVFQQIRKVLDEASAAKA